jgi:Tfp pilus assembly PilM family ATPase/Tfp pilus assembly protein PilN
MNLLKIISNDIQINGLEISDGSLRFCRIKKDQTELKTEYLIEEKLPETDNLYNEVAFTAKLSKFVKKNKIKYVIVSIPSDNIFIKTYSFLDSIPDEKIKESMNLVIESQLPQKKRDVYCDWMVTKNDGKKNVLLTCIDRKKIDTLTSIAKKVGLKIVAIESLAISLARSIKQINNEATLLIEKELVNTSFSVILNNDLIFTLSIPNDKIGKNIKKEIQRVVNYHDWLNINIKNSILFGDFKEEEIKKIPLKMISPETLQEINGFSQETKWFISLGAALRGLILRKDDHIVSLMEISTRKAYKHEKIRSFTNFFINLSAVFSIFLIAIFIASWSFMIVVQNNYVKQITSFNLSADSENSSQLKDKAINFNNYVGQAAALISKEPHWSIVVKEVREKIVSGVVVNNLSLPSNDGVFSVSGVASDRETINQLKKSFESSTLFDEIKTPLNNLGKRVNIPFSMTFKIKSSDLIYTK